MTTTVREKFSSQAAPEVLAALRQIAENQGRQFQAVLDEALRDYIANTSHKTIIGDVKFSGSENIATPGTVSQWQNGEFEVVWPSKLATAKINPNKPAWK